jgi:hypothetical protein
MRIKLKRNMKNLILNNVLKNKSRLNPLPTVIKLTVSEGGYTFNGTQWNEHHISFDSTKKYIFCVSDESDDTNSEPKLGFSSFTPIPGPLTPIYHLTMNTIDVTYGGSVVNYGSSSQGTFTCDVADDTYITFENNYLELKEQANFTGITMNNLNVSNNYTISFWFNASDNKRTFVVGYKTSTGGYHRLEWWSNTWAIGGVFFGYYSVCGLSHANNLIYSDYGYDKWHFICIVVTGYDFHLYENGLDTNSIKTIAEHNVPTRNEFLIAHGLGYPVNGYNGLDEFKIHDSPLSLDQISTIYNSYTLPYLP